MRASSVSASSTTTEMPAVVASHRAAHDVFDVQDAPRFLGADAALAQRVDGAARDHEQHAQLGQPRDDVLGEPVGHAAPARACADVASTNGMTATEARRRGRPVELDRQSHGSTAARPRGRRVWIRADSRRVGAARAACQASRSGDQSSPSCSNARIVAARCSSASRTRPHFTSASSITSCARWSNGASCEPGVEARNASSDPERARRQLAQHGDVHRPIAVALRGQPAGELRVAVDLHAVEQVAAEQVAQLGEPLARRLLEPRLHGPVDLERIDEAVGQVERDQVVAAGDHAPAIAVVEHAAELAQAPAQLAARIVRDVPEQVAQPRT